MLAVTAFVFSLYILSELRDTRQDSQQLTRTCKELTKRVTQLEQKLRERAKPKGAWD